MLFVFDFDGTLADTRIPFREAFDEAAKAVNGMAFRTQDEPFLRTLEATEVLRAHNIAPKQFAEFTHLLRKGMENKGSRIQLVPGVAEMLDDMRDSLNPLGLISSNSNVLVESVLGDRLSYFQQEVFDVPVGGKTDALKKAAAEWAPPGLMCYVGDEIRDFRAAVAADVRFVGVTWGFNTEEAMRREGCEDFIRHPSELLASLARF